MLRYIMIANKNFKDINPLDCGEEVCSKNFIQKSKRFKYYILHFAFSGSGIFEISGVKHRLDKNQISIVRPNELVTYYSDRENPWHYAWIGFDATLPLPFNDDSVIIELPQANKIFRELISADKIVYGRENFICAKIHELFTMLYQNNDKQAKIQMHYVNSAKNYIENYFNTDITLDLLAKNLMISTSYFCSLFKKHTGLSPYDYLIKTRLNNSLKMITLYNYSVKKAALESGFSDSASFSKSFKKHFGYSPSSLKIKKRFDVNKA